MEIGVDGKAALAMGLSRIKGKAITLAAPKGGEDGAVNCWVNAASAKEVPRSPLGLALLAGLFMLALTARLWAGPFTIDDGYITFRYARNLAQGLGFVYNAGEHVLGTTTPLWTLILAVSYALGFSDLPRAALCVSTLADASTSLLLYWIARSVGWQTRWAALVAALFAVNPFSVFFAASGMESSLFTFLVVSAAFADLRGRPAWAGLAAGLASVVRPEGMLMGGIVLGRYLLQRRLPPMRAIFAYLAPILPWVAFATWYFGSPIPQSMVAKAAAYRWPWPVNAAYLLLQLGSPAFCWITLHSTVRSVAPTFVSALVGSTAIVIAGAQARRSLSDLRARPELWVLSAFAPLLAASYVLAGLRNVELFDWYLVPLLPFYMLGAVLFARRITPRLPGYVAWLTAAVALSLWTALPMSLGQSADRGPFMPRGVATWREQAYAVAAQQLETRLKRAKVVALSEIGTFGYLTEARVLDTVGLISPVATRFYPVLDCPGDNCVPPDLIAQERPDYLVSFEVFLQPLHNSQWFDRDYRLLTQVDAASGRGLWVGIYERRDLP